MIRNPKITWVIIKAPVLLSQKFEHLGMKATLKTTQSQSLCSYSFPESEIKPKATLNDLGTVANRLQQGCCNFPDGCAIAYLYLVPLNFQRP